MSTCCFCFRPKKVSINWLIDHIFLCAYSSIRGQLTKPINKLLKQIVSKWTLYYPVISPHRARYRTASMTESQKYANRSELDIFLTAEKKQTKQKPGEVSVVWANLGLWLHTISLLTADSLKEHCTSDFDIKITTNRQICLNWIKPEPRWHRECLVRDAFSADHTRILKHSLQKKEKKKMHMQFCISCWKSRIQESKALTFNHLKYLF